MIGFDNIGKMGRLGNQMFQHAAVKGIARKHGYVETQCIKISLFLFLP